MEEMPTSQQKPDTTIIIQNNSGAGELNGLAVFETTEMDLPIARSTAQSTGCRR
jgi:hypothetical protein